MNAPFLPPQAPHTEQALLGLLMRSALVPECLRGEHFADPVHGVIFDAISRRRAADKGAAIGDMMEEFRDSSALDEVGGVAYLMQLVTGLSPDPAAEALSRAVVALWDARQLVDRLDPETPPWCHDVGEVGAMSSKISASNALVLGRDDAGGIEEFVLLAPTEAPHVAALSIVCQGDCKTVTFDVADVQRIRAWLDEVLRRRGAA